MNTARPAIALTWRIATLLLVGVGLCSPLRAAGEPQAPAIASASAGAGNSLIESRPWIVVLYRGVVALLQPVLSVPDDPHGPISLWPPSLAFAGGVLSGSPGCGAFKDGRYTLSGSDIDIHPGGYRLRGYCPPNLIEQGELLRQALARVRRINPDATRFETSREVGLVVLDGDRGEAEVVLAPIGTVCRTGYACSAPSGTPEVR
jgi:hypothetical protein